MVSQSVLLSILALLTVLLSWTIWSTAQAIRNPGRRQRAARKRASDSGQDWATISYLSVCTVETSIGNRNFGMPNLYRYRFDFRFFKLYPWFLGILSVSEIMKVGSLQSINFTIWSWPDNCSNILTLFRAGSERFDSGLGGLFGPLSDLENHTSEQQTANDIW